MPPASAPLERVMTVSPLDPEILAQLVEDVGEEALPVLLGSFLDEIDRQMATIKDGLAANDRASGERGAHSLKSTAGTFGALDLQAHMHAIEFRAKAPPSGADSLSLEFADLMETAENLSQSTKQAIASD